MGQDKFKKSSDFEKDKEISKDNDLSNSNHGNNNNNNTNNPNKNKKNNSLKFHKIRDFLNHKLIHNFKIKHIMLIILGFILLFVIINLTIKFDFMIKDDLHIGIKPIHEKIIIKNNEDIILNFEVENNNLRTCKTFCNFNIYDPYIEKTIINETQNLKPNSKIEKTYNLDQISLKGKGQRLFYFQAECHNIKTFFCKTNEEKRYRSALITLDYELTEFQNKTRKELFPKLNQFEYYLKKSKNYFQKDQTLLLNINKIKNINQTIKKFNDNAKIVNGSEEKLMNYYELWNDFNYFKLDRVFSNHDLDKIKQLSYDLNKTYNELLENINQYNNQIKQLSKLQNLDEIPKAFKFYQKHNNLEKTSEISKQIQKLKELINYIENYDFYKEFNEIFKLNNTFIQEINNLSLQYQRDVNNPSYDLSLLIYKKSTILNQYYQELNTSRNFKIINQSSLEIKSNNSNTSYLSTKNKLNHSLVCNKLSKIINEFERINNHSNGLSSNNKLEFKIIYDAFRSKIINQTILVNYNVSNDKYVISNFSNDFLDNYNITNNLVNGTFNKSNISLIKKADKIFIDNDLNITKEQYIKSIIFKINSLERKKTYYCDVDLDNLNFDYQKIKQFNTINISNIEFNRIINEDNSFTKHQNITFEENLKKCCIFENCTGCLNFDETYNNHTPIIFLHGHSFNVNNDVEGSLDSFSFFQRKLAEDEYVINAGDIDATSITKNYHWSLMPYPISIKASYYYIFYYDLEFYTAGARKDEGIENYAIRLKEIIEKVKLNTNSKKVNIVAHSMGGLVARTYLRLFGEQDIEKMVLIGTPNKGVSGRVDSLCDTFGAKKECQDMSKDSIFMKKLNSFIPQKTEIYTIYGTGCEKNTANGDGIVEADSVKLDYATNYNVKGECKSSLGYDFHQNLIYPKHYPKVYNKVVEILFN